MSTMVETTALLQLPCNIRRLIDKQFIENWVSLELIQILGPRYSVIAFDLYFWLFNRKYESEVIDLNELDRSLAYILKDYCVDSRVIVKGLERVILLDYLGEIPASRKDDVMKSLEREITKNGQNLWPVTELSLKLVILDRSIIISKNRSQFFDYIGSQLSMIAAGERDQLAVTQLRVMENVFPEEVNDVDMNLLAMKLQDDLGLLSRPFVHSLQQFFLGKEK